MSYPLVRDLAAEGFPVRLTCGVLGFSTQGYYAWLAAPVSDRDLTDAYLTNALLDAHGDDPAFGYRFLADELEQAGIEVGERRVWRLCSQQKIWSTTVRKGRRGSGKRPGPAVHDDHIQRNFTAAEPNRTWVTDVTEHPTAWIPAVVATPSGGVGAWLDRSTATHRGMISSGWSTEVARFVRRRGRRVSARTLPTGGCAGPACRCSVRLLGGTRRRTRPSSSAG